jgi:hypothetical protein
MTDIFTVVGAAPGLEGRTPTSKPRAKAARKSKGKAKAKPARKPSTESRFEAFHKEHPEVFAELARLAFEEINDKNQSRVGIRCLWEVTRYNLRIKARDTGGSGFKLNNDYHSRYARKLVETYPALRPFFEFRRQRSR